METLISRYRNVTILVAILFVQVLGLAVQVKRNTENEPTRLIRIWAVNSITPFEKAIVWTQSGTHNLWHSYLYLRGVRQENRDLKAEIERLRLEQVRLREDAEQARRLQLLLGFKEQFISQTLAAQVIGSSGSEQSRSVYIDKGEKAGIKPDMAVITADGVVGKVLRVFGSTAQVLLIDDQTSGVGAILEKSRLQGILRGTPSGEVMLEKVMSDETVQPGERVLTSGGDLVFPKGMPVGTVASVDKGKESFLNIRIKPAANLSKLEEVLVITRNEEKAPSISENGSERAVDILAQRLPSVPQKAPVDASQPPPPTSGLAIAPAPAGTKLPATMGTAAPKAPQGVANSNVKATTAANPAATSAQRPLTATPKPHLTGTPAATANQPAGGAAETVKPSTGSAMVTPATEQKPAPAAVKVSDITTKDASPRPAGSVAKPAANAVKPPPKPSTPPADSPSTPPPAPEDKPQ